MRINKLKVLNNDEIERIHNSTLVLLEEVGIKIESEDIRSLLKEHSMFSDDDNKRSDFIKFPRDSVKKILRKVPKEFTLWNPDGSYNFTIDTKSIHFGTFGAAINIYDPKRRKEIRKAKLADTKNHLLIVNELENIACSHMDLWPGDVPFTELHFHTLREWGRYGKKPYGMGCYGRTASKDMMEVAGIISGGIDTIKEKPRLLGVFNPTSPLTLPKILLNGLEIFAKYKQPLNISSAGLAGSSAPVTLAGTLIQSNMEILSSIIITQIINPGTPVLYGSTNTIMDPSTGNTAYGSIEMGLITAASAQMAHFYDIPSKGSGCLTESKCFDLQNGYERFMTLLFAANAGHNYITCAGTYETSLSEAFELLVVDNDLIGMIRRELEGINIDENTMAIQEIMNVAKGKQKSYLGTKHSAKFTRKEIFVPAFSNRERRGKWIKNGKKPTHVYAQERVNTILAEDFPSNLSTSIENQLEKYFQIISSRTLEDYMHNEGLDKKEGSNILSNII